MFYRKYNTVKKSERNLLSNAKVDEKNEVTKNLKHTIKKIAFADIFKGVCIVDNTTAGMGEGEDEAYKYLRDEIHKFDSNTLIVKTPIKWVLLRKVLQVLVRESEKNIITLHEACLSDFAMPQPLSRGLWISF